MYFGNSKLDIALQNIQGNPFIHYSLLDLLMIKYIIIKIRLMYIIFSKIMDNIYLHHIIFKTIQLIKCNDKIYTIMNICMPLSIHVSSLNESIEYSFEQNSVISLILLIY